MIKFSFALPAWLHWLVPFRVREDHDKRIAVTGRASTAFAKGSVVVTSSLINVND